MGVIPLLLQLIASLLVFLIPAICFLVTFSNQNASAPVFPSHLLHLANRCHYKDRLRSIFSQVCNIRTCEDESGLTKHDEQLANVLLLSVVTTHFLAVFCVPF